MKLQLACEGKAYSLKHTDTVRKESTSGGAFTAISDVILSQNGYICGATFNEKMEVVHQITNSFSGRNAMRGSKYTQSSLRQTPLEIEQLLLQGKHVFFIGTPCQVAALRNYMELKKIDTTLLVTCDFVCHGVQSPQITTEYFELISSGKKLKNYHFREKSCGWHSHQEKPVFEGDEQTFDIWLTRAHVRLHGTHYTTRPCCYDCAYANLNRIADITIGDCWGIEKIDPRNDDNKGLSLVLINTLKGKKIMEAIDYTVMLKEHELADLIQPRLKIGFTVPKEREKFWQYYYKNGLKKSLRKFTMYGIKGRIWFYSTRILRKTKLTGIIKKVVKNG